MQTDEKTKRRLVALHETGQNITRMHGSALRCVRRHSRSIWNMANL